jgi:argininosuccinate synthase
VVRVRLFKGQATVVGRQSPHSLYDFNLASYGEADAFDHDAAVPFIKLYSQSLRTQARIQLGSGMGQEIRSLTAPDIDPKSGSDK